MNKRNSALMDAPLRIMASKPKTWAWGDQGRWYLDPKIGMAVEYVRFDVVEEYRRALMDIVDSWDARSELYTSDEDCAANLADHARKALARQNCGCPRIHHTGEQQ